MPYSVGQIWCSVVISWPLPDSARTRRWPALTAAAHAPRELLAVNSQQPLTGNHAAVVLVSAGGDAWGRTDPTWSTGASPPPAWESSPDDPMHYEFILVKRHEPVDGIDTVDW